MELYGFHCEDALYLLEALFGTERAATWLVARLEQLGTLTVGNPHDRLLAALECLGWMLLRLADTAPAVRARVERLGANQASCARAFLDVALDHEAGWKALEQVHLTGECCFITRIAALSRSGAVVNELVARRRLSPWGDPQLAHLAGAALCDVPLETRGWEKARKAALAETFGVLLHEPVIARAVVPFAAGALPKAKLRAWVELPSRALSKVLPEVEAAASAAEKKRVAAVRALLL